jgi:L-fucose mutarotase/ribose pyranase (RbsD/FucU family)
MSYLDDDIVTKNNMATIDEHSRETSVVDEYLEKIRDDGDRLKAIEYIGQLDFYDKVALLLSIEILGSSFDLLKSNGYHQWYSTYKKIK